MTTSNFGFTRIQRGDSLAKNGYAALDSDRVALDDLLFALSNHTHDASPRLDSPTSAATLSAFDSAGSLPGNVTFYYAYALLDRWGLETRPSPEVSVTTPEGGSRPAAPLLDHIPTGGNLNAGRYGYVITYLDPAKGGETDASEVAFITISTDACSGECKIQLEFEAPPPGFPCVNIYRMRPGQTRLYFLARVEDASVFVDDGFTTEDQTIVAPRFNTTGTTSSIEVTVPALPEGASGWRLYRTNTPGLYSDSSLVATVVTTEEEAGGPIVTTYIDDGSSLTSGRPRERNLSLGGGHVVDLAQVQGRFPLTAIPRGGRLISQGAPSLPRGRTQLARIPWLLDGLPTHLAASFEEAPELTDATLRLRVEDEAGGAIDLSVASGERYAVRTLPLTDGRVMQAESADRHANAFVVVDTGAQGSQAVRLSANDHWIYADFGALDAGPYRTAVIAKGNGNLLITLTADGQTTQAHTVNTATYTEFAGPSFTLAEAGTMTLEVGRTDTGSEDVLVDVLLYASTIPTLEAGSLTLTSRVVPNVSIDTVTSTMAGYTQASNTQALLAALNTMAGGGKLTGTASREGGSASFDLANTSSATLTFAQGTLSAASADDRVLVRRAVNRVLAQFFFQGDPEVDLRDVLAPTVTQGGTSFVVTFALTGGLLTTGDSVYFVAQGLPVGEFANISVWV